jgi:aspartate/glutamate racemase
VNVDKESPEGQLLQSCCNTLHKVVGVRHAMMFASIHDEQSAREVLARHNVQDVQVLANMATEEAEQLLEHLKNVGIEPPAYD